jgi:hypothetical protein
MNKYFLLLLIPLIENVCSFQLISSSFVQPAFTRLTLESAHGLTVHKRTVNNPIKMCSVGLSSGQSNSSVSPYRSDSSNSYLDNLNMNNIMNNFIKKNDVKTNNIINSPSPPTSPSPKINTNTLFFNTYYVDDLLIEKNLTKIILNLRKGNNSLYYINKTNNIETIRSSGELSSKIIKNLIFTDLNKVMNNSLGIIYDDMNEDDI